MPALLGLPILANLLVVLFTSLFTFVVRYISMRLAIGVAFIALFSALISSFLSWGLSQLDSLIASVPVLASVGYLLPDNTAICVSAIVSTDVMCGVYSLGSRVLFKKTDIATP